VTCDGLPVTLPSMTATRQAAKPSSDRAVVIQATNLHKTFHMGTSSLEILKGADLSVRQGEFVAIEGRSGSGKSTMLHLMGLLDTPDQGSIVIHGEDVAKLGNAERCRIRNREVGFVFQFYHLLPELNVLQNTLLAAMVEKSTVAFAGERASLHERAETILKTMNLSHRLTHRPNQLSGGERQRVAIARALMNQPKILLADEPTGNLDYETGQQIMAVLNSLHTNGQTIVMVTHDRALARQADRVFVLREGKLLPAGE
jgi:ABC-type lipoprotein export system ATPase subunit